MTELAPSAEHLRLKKEHYKVVSGNALCAFGLCAFTGMLLRSFYHPAQYSITYWLFWFLGLVLPAIPFLITYLLYLWADHQLNQIQHQQDGR